MNELGMESTIWLDWNNMQICYFSCLGLFLDDMIHEVAGMQSAQLLLSELRENKYERGNSI